MKWKLDKILSLTYGCRVWVSETKEGRLFLADKDIRRQGLQERGRGLFYTILISKTEYGTLRTTGCITREFLSHACWKKDLLDMHIEQRDRAIQQRKESKHKTLNTKFAPSLIFLCCLLTCFLFSCNKNNVEMETQKTELNEQNDIKQNKDTYRGYSHVEVTGGFPIVPIGMREKAIEYVLDSSQLSFIRECKIAGKTECLLTIDNRQVYVSFYENAE